MPEACCAAATVAARWARIRGGSQARRTSRGAWAAVDPEGQTGLEFKTLLRQPPPVFTP